ncbi:MAG: ATP-binding protein, partial [Gammaproteobacteria bacterium]|nr:ATP-binding protein [Gammaproteobacteria bacterium]
MASNYYAICQENIRKYGEEPYVEILSQLYSDRTHFIYELLQNAEDAGATHVKITLHRNRLEVLHDGKIFDEADVEGICGVGKGTKSEESTKIGKFVIGFKSVYAY